MSSQNTIRTYTEKLAEQKKLYEQMLDLSEQEKEILCTKHARLGKVISFLTSKESLLRKISSIESEIAPLREIFSNADVSDEDRGCVSLFITSIGKLLENLLRIDAENEQLLQHQLHTGSKPINTNRAIQTYQTMLR